MRKMKNDQSKYELRITTDTVYSLLSTYINLSKLCEVKLPILTSKVLFFPSSLELGNIPGSIIKRIRNSLTRM